MKDYFNDVKEYLNCHYKLTVMNEKQEKMGIFFEYIGINKISA